MLWFLYHIYYTLSANNFGMNAGNWQYWTDLYYQFNGPALCTPDLDAVNQAQYVVVVTLNTLTTALGYGPLFDLPC